MLFWPPELLVVAAVVVGFDDCEAFEDDGLADDLLVVPAGGLGIECIGVIVAVADVVAITGSIIVSLNGADDDFGVDKQDSTTWLEEDEFAAFA